MNNTPKRTSRFIHLTWLIYFAISFCCILSSDLFAQPFSLINIPQHGTSYTISPNCTVSISSSGAGTQQWQGSNIGAGGIMGTGGNEAQNCANQTGLRLEMTGAGNGSGTAPWNNSITVVFTFPHGIKGPATFNIFDFTEPLYYYINCYCAYYQDKATISAIKCDGTAVTPTLTSNNGPISSSVAGSSLILKAIRLQGQCLNEPVSVGTASDLIYQITIVYSNQDPPDNITAPVCSPARYGVSQYQYIFISNINATAPDAITASALPASICSGQSTTLTASSATSYNYTWSPATVPPTGSPVTASPTSNTTYTVTGNVGSCTNSSSVSVNVTTGLSLTASASPSNICQGQSTTLTAGGASNYTWNPGGLSGSPVTVVPSGTTTYTVTASSGGCTGQQTVTVNVTMLADATINPSGPYCLSASPVTLTAATSGGTWSGNGITNSSLGTFNPSVAGVGTHQIIYNISGPCGDADTTQIQVYSSADATITPAGPFCTNDAPYSLSAADPGGVWSGTGVNPSTGVFSPSVSGSGSFNIIYTISGTCGDADTLVVTVNQAQNATINPAGPFCPADSPVNLTAVNGGGVWSGTGITNGTLGTFDPSIAGVGTHIITYQISGICGDIDTIQLTVANSYNATINPAGPFCTNSSPFTLTAANTGGTWSGTGANPATGLFTPSVAGVGTFNIVYTISGSCGDDDTITITVNPSQNATINPAGPFCVNSSPVNLTAASSGGIWSGTGITNSSLGTFNPSVAGAGTYTITYGIAGACGDTAATSIVVNQLANATITPAGPFCSDDASYTLIAANTGGTWSGTGVNPSTGVFSPSVAGAGTFNIIYTISGACGDDDTLSIQVNPAANATINPAGPFCIVDTAATLTAAQSGGTWSGTGITNTTNGTFNPSLAGVGSYQIIYVIASPCGDADTINVNVITQADATINPAGPFCANIPATNLTAITSGGSWSGTGITNITNGTFDPSTAGQGNHIITYTIAGACGDEDTAIIKVVAAPMLAVNDIAVSCEGATDGSAGATAGGGTPPYTFHWDNNATTQNITDLSPGSYLVVVTDANGCQEARTVTVDGSTEPCEIITPVLYVPNTFTPNGDGNNDILYVRGQGVKSLEFVIYDRWGEKIFESEYTDLGGGRVSLGWDGTFHGKPMGSAVFVWRLKAEMVDDKTYRWKGSVSLLR